MTKKKHILMILAYVCIGTLIVPPCSYAQGPQVFKAEELEQILAPIALYPDSLLTQILMASTYPLEVVQADRWAKQNKNAKGDALAKALEAQPWDPSVKSLVNFPEVLTMMSEKLDWTQKLGDAFLAQQKDVMGTVQRLRAKASASGNLKTTKEQVVKIEKEVIIIEPASPQVIYVPAYNPAVVYGTWAYPAYPPYPVYPPGYVATTAAFSFMAGAAVGAAWGYAWGHSNWSAGNVDINVNRNANINTNINRQKYATQYQGKGQAGQGQWQHDASHRGGVAYRDKGTAQKYNRGASAEAVKTREAYRGKTGQGARDISKQPAGGGTRQGTMESTGKADRPGTSKQGPSTMQSGGKQSAFSGMDKGSNAKAQSDRGSASRQNMSKPSPSSGGGASRPGGGGSRGGRRR
ncbi:MAG: DUF3300 domain-containing protein [Syntrophorhabdaceae bacterium]|nr:DUF3300 domain-containing protein [Syntrophorhabdaceae bacterium]